MQAHELFDKHANTYQKKYMDVTMYADELTQLCSLLPPQASVLDVGCGPGNITKFLLAQRPDLYITGIDMASTMIQLAAANNTAATFIEMDCRNINSLSGKYRAIVLGFCLPYLDTEEMQRLIADAATIMTPGALLYISTMEHTDQTQSGIKRSSTGDEIYIHYHAATLIERTIASAGFSVITEKRQPAINGDSDLIILASKIN